MERCFSSSAAATILDVSWKKERREICGFNVRNFCGHPRAGARAASTPRSVSVAPTQTLEPEIQTPRRITRGAYLSSTPCDQSVETTLQWEFVNPPPGQAPVQRVQGPGGRPVTLPSRIPRHLGRSLRSTWPPRLFALARSHPNWRDHACWPLPLASGEVLNSGTLYLHNAGAGIAANLGTSADKGLPVVLYCRACCRNPAHQATRSH